MSSDTERPELEATTGKLTSKKWAPSKEIEEEVLEMAQGVLPTKLRASDAQLEEFYHIAYNLYRAGNYEKALPFFHLLIMARPQEARYVRALASTYQMMKDYYQAIGFYTASTFLDAENPYPHYYSADCWRQLNEPIGAYASLEMGIKAAASNPQYKGLLDRMVTQMRKLEKEFEEKKKLGASLEGRTVFGDFPSDIEELGRILKPD